MKGDYCASRHQVRSIITHIDRKIGFLSVEGHSQQARQMNNFLLGTAFTKSSAGWIFEGRVHACLRRGGTFKIRSLETSRAVFYSAAVTFESLNHSNFAVRGKPKGAETILRERGL